MTRNRRANRLTVEKLTHDCLDLRELKREAFSLNAGSSPSIRWPKIARMTIEHADLSNVP